jgi:hypothetical protein
MSGRAVLVLDPSELPHCPTPESRDFVAQLVAVGLEVPEISFCLKCTPHEVMQHYKDEITHGTAMINARVGVALFQRAMMGDVNAQKFWLQTRARWVPADKEDPKKAEQQGQLKQDRQAFMNDILQMVAKGRAKEEQGTVTSRATPGSRRTQ